MDDITVYMLVAWDNPKTGNTYTIGQPVTLSQKAADRMIRSGMATPYVPPPVASTADDGELSPPVQSTADVYASQRPDPLEEPEKKPPVKRTRRKPASRSHAEE